MKRAKKVGSAGLALSLAGCVGPEAGSEAWVWGTLMIVLGVALAVALVLSLND